MGIRYDLPKVPSTTQPTPLNHTTARYAFVGKLAAGLIGGVIFPHAALMATLTSVAGLLIGAKMGAAVGMEKQARELVEGRDVHEPTYWNKGILSGLVVGGAISTALFLVASVVTAAAGVVGVAAPVIATGAGLFALVGMAVGSIAQHHHLVKDYDRAVTDYNMQVSQARAQQVQQGFGGVGQYMNSVSPQESQALEARQAANANSGFAQQVNDNAQNLAAQAQR